MCNVYARSDICSVCLYHFVGCGLTCGRFATIPAHTHTHVSWTHPALSSVDVEQIFYIALSPHSTTPPRQQHIYIYTRFHQTKPRIRITCALYDPYTTYATSAMVFTVIWVYYHLSHSIYLNYLFVYLWGEEWYSIWIAKQGENEIDIYTRKDKRVVLAHTFSEHIYIYICRKGRFHYMLFKAMSTLVGGWGGCFEVRIQLSGEQSAWEYIWNIIHCTHCDGMRRKEGEDWRSL